jgi:hypothetical protein
LHLSALSRIGTEAAQIFITDVEEARAHKLFPHLPIIRIG